MNSTSISPAIVNIHISSTPLTPEKKSVMLKEIEKLLTKHDMTTGNHERPSGS